MSKCRVSVNLDSNSVISGSMYCSVAASVDDGNFRSSTHLRRTLLVLHTTTTFSSDPRYATLLFIFLLALTL